MKKQLIVVNVYMLITCILIIIISKPQVYKLIIGSESFIIFSFSCIYLFKEKQLYNKLVIWLLFWVAILVNGSLNLLSVGAYARFINLYIMTILTILMFMEKYDKFEKVLMSSCSLVLFGTMLSIVCGI